MNINESWDEILIIQHNKTTISFLNFFKSQIIFQYQLTNNNNIEGGGEAETQEITTFEEVVKLPNYEIGALVKKTKNVRDDEKWYFFVYKMICQFDEDEVIRKPIFDMIKIKEINVQGQGQVQREERMMNDLKYYKGNKIIMGFGDTRNYEDEGVKGYDYMNGKCLWKIRIIGRPFMILSEMDMLMYCNSDSWSSSGKFLFYDLRRKKNVKNYNIQLSIQPKKVIQIEKNVLLFVGKPGKIEIWKINEKHMNIDKRPERMCSFQGHKSTKIDDVIMVGRMYFCTVDNRVVKVWKNYTYDKVDCVRPFSSSGEINIHSLKDNSFIVSCKKILKVYNIRKFKKGFKSIQTYQYKQSNGTIHSVLYVGNPKVFKINYQSKLKQLHDSHVEIEDEKIDELMYLNECFNDFEVNIYQESSKINTSVKFPRSILINSSDCLKGVTKKDIDFDKKFVLNEYYIYRLLFGKDDILNTLTRDEYFNLFLFFKKLNMKKAMYILCKKLKTLNICDVALLFVTSVEYFEKGKKEVKKVSTIKKSFNSVFSLALANILKPKISHFLLNDKESNEVKKLVRKYISYLKNYEKRQIKDHEDLRNIIYPPGSFSSLFQRNLSTFFKKKRFHNLKLKCGKKMFKVHKEILILRSNFFAKLFSFKGKEYHEMFKNNVIEISILDDLELESLIEYIYTDNISSRDLKTCLNLLVHAMMFFDKKLENVVLNVLTKIITYFYKRNALMKKFNERCIDKIYRKIPEGLFKKLIKNWSKNLDVKTSSFLKVLPTFARTKYHQLW